jgi:hypothetical protein
VASPRSSCHRPKAEMYREVQSCARVIVLPEHYVADAKSRGCTWVVTAQEAFERNQTRVPLDVLGPYLDAIHLHHIESIDWDLSRFTWLYDESRDRLQCHDNVTKLVKPAWILS